MNPLIVLDIAARIADRLAQTPAVPVDSRDKPVVQQQVAKELKPVLEHLTNSEPWFRSRVTWGAIFAILGGIASIGTMLANGVPLSFETYGPPLGSIGGGIGTLWGRWAARKPIGA